MEQRKDSKMDSKMKAVVYTEYGPPEVLLQIMNSELA
jgi:hypothetical protein